MFAKNLKYYRLKNNLSKKELAALVGVTPMSITYYENGQRKPSMAVIKALSEALHVKVSDFLANWDENLTFSHGEFSKNSRLTQQQQNFICASVEEYMGRFYSVVKILGENVLPVPPVCHRLQLSGSAEDDSKELRRFLDISAAGPVGNLVEMLENKGVLVDFEDIDTDAFSGMNGMVAERPYIVLNGKMHPERIRSTVAHEIAHLFFKWPDTVTDKEIENRATAISGAFLFSEEDAKRELGLRRSAVTKDMAIACEEYGISMHLLVKRAESCGIIKGAVAKDFYIKAAGKRDRKQNDDLMIRIPKETPTLFTQLVFRAVSESEISIQKGSELLKQPYEYVADRCFAACN